MGYQYKDSIAPYELAKTVELRIEPFDCLDSAQFIALIQRRLFGRVVCELSTSFFSAPLLNYNLYRYLKAMS
jgi:hypothetical protein